MAKNFDIEEEEIAGATSALSRSSAGKSLIRAVKEIAETRGIKFSDAVAEALDTWTLATTLENVDAKALVAAIQLYRTMINDSIKMISSSVTLLSSSFMESLMKMQQSYMETAQQAMAQQLAAVQATQNEPKEVREPPNQVQQMLQPIIQQLMMNTLMQLMEKLMPGMGNALKQSQALSSNANSNLQSIKVVE